MKRSRIMAAWHMLSAAVLVFIALTIGIGELGHVRMDEWYRLFFTAIAAIGSIELLIITAFKVDELRAAAKERQFAPDHYSVLH